MANRQKATVQNILREVNRSPGRKFRLYMYGLIMSSLLTLAFLKARDAHTNEHSDMELAELDNSLLVNDVQFAEIIGEPTGDTGGNYDVVEDMEALEYIETFGWPMEDYGVEVPDDCHVPPDFNQPELQDVCVKQDVPKSECSQFLHFAWTVGAADVHPALGYRPGCLD